jgi:RimJ/RimL family protein N-acetyltransferase
VPLTDAIEWSAALPEHRPYLESFVCATPAESVWDKAARIRRPHPEPWALLVQSAIRTTHPPLPPDERMLLGFLDGRLVAVSHYGFTRDFEEKPQLLVMLLATSVDARGCGIGQEALRVTIDILRQTRDANGDGCAAVAKIHPKNHASRHLFERAGFYFLDDYDDRSGLEYWVHDLT